MNRVWSKYQEAVFDFCDNNPRNGIVEAMPGSGKTTVIEEAINRVPFDQSVLAISFTRIIRDELRRRLEHLPNVTVHTLNSFGNSVCKEHLGWYKLNENKLKNILKFDLFGFANQGYTKEKFAKFCKVVSAILKLVALSKAHMMFERADFEYHWRDLAEQYDVTIPEDVDDFERLLIATHQLDQTKTKVIDWDDQIAIPLRRNFPIPQFHRVFVDETQDLTPAQIELTKRAIRKGGRGLYVGDRNQSIYQFRGADSRAMDNITEVLDCVQLPLSICYRCSKAVIRAAQQIVPGIESFDGAVEGSENTIYLDEFQKIAKPGDVVLCRTTAPLVQSCLWFIRHGVKSVVKGRDIGANLKELVLSLVDGDETVSHESLRDSLRVYLDKETEKNKRSENETRQIAVQDNVDTIVAVMGTLDTVAEILAQFDQIFGEADSSAITHMTIHKAKGLEAPRIFILRPDQMPHRMAKSPEAIVAEINLKFVAITRSQIDLYWVWEKRQ